ncbi:MAG: exodeoxyribonuclease VII small subunit [Candidatus Baltobacteraceae bacterium]
MAESEPQTFEEKLARLEAIVKELENGNVELDRSVALFNEGKMLAAQCEELLKGSQAKIDRTMERPSAAPSPASDEDEVPF